MLAGAKANEYRYSSIKDPLSRLMMVGLVAPDKIMQGGLSMAGLRLKVRLI